MVDGNINNLEAVADAVKRGYKRLGTRTKNVAMAVPTGAVITKKIIVPAGLREDELEMQVETEANQYIPFALEEVNLDFQVVGPSPTTPDEQEVLIAASRKEKVEDRVAVAESAGLKAAGHGRRVLCAADRARAGGAGSCPTAARTRTSPSSTSAPT